MLGSNPSSIIPTQPRPDHIVLFPPVVSSRRHWHHDGGWCTGVHPNCATKVGFQGCTPSWRTVLLSQEALLMCVYNHCAGRLHCAHEACQTQAAPRSGGCGWRPSCCCCWAVGPTAPDPHAHPAGRRRAPSRVRVVGNVLGGLCSMCSVNNTPTGKVK
jgi:hypothetical protein